MHRDDDPANNAVDNLEYGTPAQNSAQMVARRRSATGENHGRSKLTAAVVAEIRRQLCAGRPVLRIASDFGVARATVRAVRDGKTWKGVD
jgi:hypothetical protein